MANEEFLQFIWKHELFNRRKMQTTCGKSLEIYSPGEHNFHAGPDFFNARIRVDQLVWAGNVEIHSNASDWLRHGHQKDPSYDNVILHVVGSFDSEIWNSCGRRILATVLEYPEYIISRYKMLRAHNNWLPCHEFIRKVSSLKMQHWITCLQSERLQMKTGRISRILMHRDLDREETLFRAMASGYGLPINSLPFEMMTSGIPLQLLFDLRDSLLDLEAVLFGRSGFLHPEMIRGTYVTNLMERFSRRAKSLNRNSVPRHLWKFLRLRPASFPTLRISQFASLIQLRYPLTDSLLSFSSLTEIEQLLRVKASHYWDTHYVFGKCSPPSVKYMGHQAILTLIINVIVPFLNALGKKEHRISAVPKAKEILSEMEAESNRIIKNWINFGMKPRNAFESQAYIQLYNGYCKQKRCLDCLIGAGFIEGRP
jgi:hypothetical protein